VSEEKSFFSGISSLFVEKVSEDVDPAPTAPQTSPSPLSPMRVTSSQAVDQELLAHVRSQVFGIESSLYKRFMAECDNLRDVIPDQQVLMRAALKASRLSAVELVRELQTTHVGAIDSVRSQFAAQKDKRLKEGVEKPREKIEAIRSDNTAREAEITKLRDEIAKAQTDVASLEREIAAAESDVATRERSFAAVVDTVESELKGTIQALGSLK
jgi:hypothetical protein